MHRPPLLKLESKSFIYIYISSETLLASYWYIFLGKFCDFLSGVVGFCREMEGEAERDFFVSWMGVLWWSLRGVDRLVTCDVSSIFTCMFWAGL